MDLILYTSLGWSYNMGLRWYNIGLEVQFGNCKCGGHAARISPMLGASVVVVQWYYGICWGLVDASGC